MWRGPAAGLNNNRESNRTGTVHPSDVSERLLLLFRVLTRSMSMLLVFHTLARSLMEMGNVTVLTTMCFLIFAILGVRRPVWSPRRLQCPVPQFEQAILAGFPPALWCVTNLWTQVQLFAGMFYSCTDTSVANQVWHGSLLGCMGIQAGLLVMTQL